MSEPGDRSAEVYAAAVRSLSFEEKLCVSEGLRALAWELKAGVFRREHPEWSEDQVQQLLREVFLRAGAGRWKFSPIYVERLARDRMPSRPERWRAVRPRTPPPGWRARARPSAPRRRGA